MILWRKKTPPRDPAPMYALCAEVADLLRGHGFANTARAITPRALPVDFDQRLNYMLIFRDLIAAKDAAQKPKDLLWRFFARMKLTPESDIFDRIEDEDIYEVYDMDGNQIFRNLSYFTVSSLSVEDIICMNWKKDFKRSSKITLELVALTFRLATGILRRTYDCANIPKHTVEELLAGRNKIELGLKLVSPLKRDGRCVAILATSRARII